MYGQSMQSQIKQIDLHRITASNNPKELCEENDIYSTKISSFPANMNYLNQDLSLKMTSINQVRLCT